MAKKTTSRRRGASPAVKAPPYINDSGVMDQISGWIAGGATEHQIAEAIRANWPDANAQPLIVKALQTMAENAAVDTRLLRGWCFEATREIHRRAMQAGDMATALRAIKQMLELGGAPD